MTKGVALSVWRELMGTVRAMPDAAAMSRCAVAIREATPTTLHHAAEVSAFVNDLASRATAASPVDGTMAAGP